jgi:hypothetical protein
MQLTWTDAPTFQSFWTPDSVFHKKIAAARFGQVFSGAQLSLAVGVSQSTNCHDEEQENAFGNVIPIISLYFRCDGIFLHLSYSSPRIGMILLSIVN